MPRNMFYLQHQHIAHEMVAKATGGTEITDTVVIVLTGRTGT